MCEREREREKVCMRECVTPGALRPLAGDFPGEMERPEEEGRRPAEEGPAEHRKVNFVFCFIDLDNFFNFVDLVDFVDLVNFSLFNRIVGVSPCHPQERTGVVVRESNTLKGFKDFCP